MLHPMPMHDYLTGLLIAVAHCIKECPPGLCDRATAHRILDRLEPYVGAAASELCEYECEDEETTDPPLMVMVERQAANLARAIGKGDYDIAAKLIDILADDVRALREP